MTEKYFTELVIDFRKFCRDAHPRVLQINYTKKKET